MATQTEIDSLKSMYGDDALKMVQSQYASIVNEHRHSQARGVIKRGDALSISYFKLPGRAMLMRAEDFKAFQEASGVSGHEALYAIRHILRDVHGERRLVPMAVLDDVEDEVRIFLGRSSGGM